MPVLKSINPFTPTKIINYPQVSDMNLHLQLARSHTAFVKYRDTSFKKRAKRRIEALTEAGLRSQVKIMIGGAPVTEEYASNIGADGVAPDASRAASLALELLS